MRFVSFLALPVRGSVMLKYLHFVRNSDTLLFLFGYLGECSCGGVDDKTADNDVVGNERMVLHPSHRRPNALFRVAEAVEPLVEVDVPLHFCYLVSTDPFTYQLLHVLTGHLPGAAISVVDEHDLFNAQLIDAHDDRSHDGIVVVEDDTASYLNYLHLTVLDA